MRSSSFREPGRSGGPAPLAWMLGALLAASFTPARGDVHGDALRRALQYAEKHHYANIRVDDRISQATLDNYLTALDGQRLYFTREDAQRLRAQYGDRLDDAMRAGQADPALEIFSLYQERRQRFLALSGDFLKTRPNLNTAREWVPDRSNAPRPANQAEMEAMWRDKLRFELIGLMLGNRTRQARKGRPKRSTTTRESASSRGTCAAPKRRTPARSPSAS